MINYAWNVRILTSYYCFNWIFNLGKCGAEFPAKDKKIKRIKVKMETQTKIGEDNGQIDKLKRKYEKIILIRAEIR